MLTLILLACVKAEDPRHVGKFIPTKTINGQITLFSARFSSFDCITSRVVSKMEALFRYIILVSKPQMKVWKVEFMRCSVHITCFG
jgi:hypothetical protein